MGVRGIELKHDDYVVGMEIVDAADKNKDIMIVTENGLGKRTAISAWPLQKRGGQGVKAAALTDKTGKIVSCVGISKQVDQIVLTSKSAQIIKLPLKGIPQLGRDTQGVILMRFAQKGDSIAAVTHLEKEETN
jgi:DNA gyrase subunit A